MSLTSIGKYVLRIAVHHQNVLYTKAISPSGVKSQNISIPSAASRYQPYRAAAWANTHSLPAVIIFDKRFINRKPPLPSQVHGVAHKIFLVLVPGEIQCLNIVFRRDLPDILVILRPAVRAKTGVVAPGPVERNMDKQRLDSFFPADSEKYPQVVVLLGSGIAEVGVPVSLPLQPGANVGGVIVVQHPEVVVAAHVLSLGDGGFLLGGPVDGGQLCGSRKVLPPPQNTPNRNLVF